MNTQETLLKQAYDALKAYFEPLAAPQQESKRWKPKYDEKYVAVNDCGDALIDVWDNHVLDNYYYSTGNCYPPTNEGKKLAIWEQVTRRQYEKALRDAADWVEGEYWECYFDAKIKILQVIRCSDVDWYTGKPRFATLQSAIDAHTRILGNDAKRYFTGEV